MQQEHKNKHIDEILGSLEEIQRAEPGALLFGKIQSKLKASVAIARVIPLRTVSVAAACILLLVVVNLLLLTKHTTANRSMQEVANYYQLTNNNPLYSL